MSRRAILLGALAAALMAATAPAQDGSVEIVVPASTRAPAALIPTDPATEKPAQNRLALALPVGPLTPVTALQFSEDGQTLYVASYGRIAAWDLASGRIARYLPGVQGAVHDLALSNDGAWLAAAGGLPARGGRVTVYDARHPNAPTAVLEGHDDVVYGVAFAPDGQRLATASADRRVILWDLQSHAPAVTIERHSDQVYDVAYTPDGKYVISAGKDLSVRVFDATTGDSARTLQGHQRPILALGAAADSLRLVTAGEEPQLRWWTLADGKQARRVNGHASDVNEISFDRARQVIATASRDERVMIWNAANGNRTKTLTGADDELFTVALSPDGKRVAAGGFRGLARVWDIESGRVLAAALTTPASAATPAYLVVTPEGYFAASEGVAAQLRWQVGGVAVEGAPFAAALGKADEVARSLAGEKVADVQFPEAQ